MLFVVLPAYNEEKGLPLLLRELQDTCRDIPHRIIVVDDGSSDRTANVVADMAREFGNIEIVSHEVNRGLGEALRSGFLRVLKYQADHAGFTAGIGCFSDSYGTGAGCLRLPDLVVTMDADNTQPAECIPQLIEAIAGGADVAIASRYVAGGEQWGLNWLRRTLSWGAGRMMHFFFPIDGVRDYSCGYRAYRWSVLETGLRRYGDLLMESESFAAMVELLLKLAPLCTRMTEVPLRLHYERKDGPSKMKLFRTVGGYLQLIYRLKRQTWGSVEWVEE